MKKKASTPSMTPEDRAAAFKRAEASLALEGLDPNRLPLYVRVKAKLIDGSMSVEEAKQAISAHFDQKTQDGDQAAATNSSTLNRDQKTKDFSG